MQLPTDHKQSSFLRRGRIAELATLQNRRLRLKYKLYFSIPEQKSVPVNGEITIEFNLDAPQEIILDFREKPEKIKSVSVNGQTARYEFHNEHIILPEKNSRKKIISRSNLLPGNQSLNRNDEFLYTLIVPDRARTLFPCFEQPESRSHIFPYDWIYQQNGKLFPIPILLKKKQKATAKQ